MKRFAGGLSALVRSGYVYLAMLSGLGGLALLGLLGLPVALVLMCLPAAIRIPMGRRLISRSLSGYVYFLRTLCGVRVDSSALDAVRLAGPLIIVANHPSLLDAVVLLARLPRAVCVMKGSLRRNILFGPIVRLSAYVSNDDPMALIRQCCDELAGGAQILIFPEGTRTRTFPVNSFSEAASFIASRSGVPVQALFIGFSSPYLGKGWPLFKRPALPLCITVKVGHKFAPARDRLKLTERLESYYRNHLADEQWEVSGT